MLEVCGDDELDDDELDGDELVDYTLGVELGGALGVSFVWGGVLEVSFV